MSEPKFRFVCLDPKKTKREAVAKTLVSLGNIQWKRMPFLGLKSFPETKSRVDAALRAATKLPTSRAGELAKRMLLAAQYNGSRAYFETNPDDIAVAWNGLNGTRRVFMDAARDAGAGTLFFELSPFAGRITVDPCGVNFRNGLPRDPAPYISWAEQGGNARAWSEIGKTITQRKPISFADDAGPKKSMDDPFLFVALQTPGDSQLRLFGGAYPTVDAVIEAVAEAAKSLPEGWHVRIKEHPTAPIRFDDLVSRLSHDKLVLDNATDTFVQVAASQGVVTVNSSVGLEAMFFEKPVVALGDCFWAIPGVAEHCPTPSMLKEMFSNPEMISFVPEARAAFLSFLTEVYYPSLETAPSVIGAAVHDRLKGPDDLGFWTCRGDTPNSPNLQAA